MTTPPRPTRDEYEDALRRIHDRRRAAGDDHPLALSEDPREVLSYLRRRGHSGLVQDDTGDDIVDGLTLRLWLWWEGEQTELWLLEAAERLKRSRRAVGETLGLTSGQGLVDRITRLRAKLRRPEHDSTTPAAATGPVDGKVRALAAALIARQDEMPEVDDEDDLRPVYLGVITDALPRWWLGEPPSEGVLNAMRFVLGDLADTVPETASLRQLVDLGVRLIGTRTV